MVGGEGVEIGLVWEESCGVFWEVKTIFVGLAANWFRFQFLIGSWHTSIKYTYENILIMIAIHK